MSSVVSSDITELIATVTIDRPPVNAMTRETYEEVREVMTSFDNRDDVRVVILTGAGKTFSAGIDMKAEFSERDPDRLVAVLKAVEDAAQAIEGCGVPVVGAINGVALAGGFVLASACDVLVAAERAQFGVPEVSVGITGGTERLRRLVPEHRARLLAFTGENIRATELEAWGGIASVVPLEELMGKAREVAGQIASRSPLTVRAVKKAQNYLERNHAYDSARYQRMLSRDLFATEDAQEAVKAFFEGRQGQFRGK